MRHAIANSMGIAAVLYVTLLRRGADKTKRLSSKVWSNDYFERRPPLVTSTCGYVRVCWVNCGSQTFGREPNVT